MLHDDLGKTHMTSFAIVQQRLYNQHQRRHLWHICCSPTTKYTIAYKDHSAVLDPDYADLVVAAFGIVIAIDG
jgi:hypothetical protein